MVINIAGLLSEPQSTEAGRNLVKIHSAELHYPLLPIDNKEVQELAESMLTNGVAGKWSKSHTLVIIR